MTTTGLLSLDHHDLCSLFNQVLIKMMIMAHKIIVFMHDDALLQYFRAIFVKKCSRDASFIVKKCQVLNYIVSNYWTCNRFYSFRFLS